MPIITEQGIYTAELCENSKKYLSCLLIGKTAINPDFLTWELLLTELSFNNSFSSTNSDIIYGGSQNHQE